MRCIFIYNPISGRGKILRHLELIEGTLSKIYDEVVMYESKSAEDIKKKAFDSCYDYDAIIFSGGDGTFNDIISGVSASKVRPPLGFIPTGTANDNARNLNIPRNIKGALKVIENQNMMKHDVGKVNDTYFVYALAAGACTATSYTTKQSAKKVIGRIAYVLNGMEEFFAPTLNLVKITDLETNNSITSEVPLILILNTKSVGGMRFNRFGHLNDGEFDIVLVKNGTGYGRFNIIGFFIHGLLGFRRNKVYTDSLTSRKFKVEISEDVYWCVDGEKGPKGTIIVENLHEHIKIFAQEKIVKKQNKKYRK